MKGNKSDERSFWEGKIIRKLLLIVIVVNLQRLNQKRKPVIYTETFVEIYNWHSKELVYKTYEIVKLEKYLISRPENSLNLDDQQFYKISQVLQNAYIVTRDIEDNTFYLNNYINGNQFN